MEEEWVERGDFLLEGGLVGGHDNVYGGEIDWLRGWGGGVI